MRTGRNVAGSGILQRVRRQRSSTVAGGLKTSLVTTSSVCNVYTSMTIPPLVVQFPCDVTINCENLDDLDATGDVIHNGDCELVGIEHIDHVLVTTDACCKIPASSGS